MNLLMQILINHQKFLVYQTTTMALGCGVSAIVALFMCSMKYFLGSKHRKFSERKDSKAPYFQSVSYSSSTLQHATGNFHTDNVLGRGEHGELFKGVLADGTEVAVKKVMTKEEQVTQEFVDTVNLISSTQHQNLVRLTGCCLERGQKLLVYEYFEQRSLAEVLLNEQTKVDIDWETRLKIAIGIARGLAYLHEYSELQIIHGDIKATNILLDKSFSPKIANYALRNLFPETATIPFGRNVVENLGYLAPEYMLQGQLTESADTFSFGILVLEIVSGRRNLDQTLQQERRLLLNWAWKLYTEARLADLVDANLGRDYSEDGIFRLIHVALLCTQASPATRPSMSRVLAMINGDEEISVFPSLPGIVHRLMTNFPSQEVPSLPEIE